MEEIQPVQPSPETDNDPLARAIAALSTRKVASSGGVNMYRRGLRGPFQTALTPERHLVATRSADGFYLDLNLNMLFDAELDPDIPMDIIPAVIDQIDTFLIPPQAVECTIEVARDLNNTSIHTTLPLVGWIDVETGAIRLDAVDQDNYYWFYFEIGPWGRADSD